MNLLIFTGYAESASLGALAARNDHEFASTREALGDLLACIRDHMDEESGGAEQNKCCRRTLKVLPAARFCATCGRTTLPGEKVDFEALAEALRDLRCQDNDGTSKLQEYLGERGWSLGDYGPGEPTAVVYAADYLLSGNPAIASVYEVNGEPAPGEDGLLRDNGELPRHDPFVLPERPRVTPEG